MRAPLLTVRPCALAAVAPNKSSAATTATEVITPTQNGFRLLSIIFRIVLSGKVLPKSFLTEVSAQSSCLIEDASFVRIHQYK